MKIHRNVKYITIIQQLKEMISTTQHLEFPLESERILAQKLHVSRGTLRKALAVLQAENLINKKNRSGTYLFPQTISRNLNAIHTIFEDIDPLSYAYEIHPQSINFVHSLPKIFSAYHQDQGFYKITRVVSLLSQAIIYEEHYLPVSLFPNIPSYISKNIFAFIEQEKKLTIAYSNQDISIQKPPKEISNLLSITPQKLLHVSSQSYLTSQELFQLTLQYFHPNYHFEIKLTR